MELKYILDLVDDNITIRLFEVQENDIMFIYEGDILAIDDNLCDRDIKNINVFDNVLEIYLN